MSQVLTHNSNGISHLSVNPVTFGEFDIVTPSDRHVSTNHKFPCYAQQVLHFSWAVYSFGGGHFASTISSWSLPFCVKLACDQYDFGRALFWEFTQCMQIFTHGKDLLNHIRSSSDCPQIHGYLIHSLRFRDSDMTSHFCIHCCWAPCHLFPSRGRCNCYSWPGWKMRQIILQHAQVSWLVFILNWNLVPHPWRYYLGIVPYYHWNPHFMHTHGWTTSSEITSTVYPLPPWLVPLGAIQSDRTFCLTGNGWC